MTRYHHQQSYADFSQHRVNEEYKKTQQDLYEAGKAWGQAGNTTIPRWYTYDRGDSTVQIPLRGHSGQEFVRGWKETRPMPTATKKTRKGRK